MEYVIEMEMATGKGKSSFFSELKPCQSKLRALASLILKVSSGTV